MPGAKGQWVRGPNGQWGRGHVDNGVEVILCGHEVEASGTHSVTAQIKQLAGRKATVVDMGSTGYFEGHVCHKSTIEIDGEQIKWPYGWWTMYDNETYQLANVVVPERKSDGIATGKKSGMVDAHGKKQASRMKKEKAKREKELADTAEAMGVALVIPEEPDTMHRSVGVGVERKPLSYHMNKRTENLQDGEEGAEAEVGDECGMPAPALVSEPDDAPSDKELDEPECGMALPEMKPTEAEEPMAQMAAPELPELRLNDDGSADAVYPDGRVEAVDPPGTHNNDCEAEADDAEADEPNVLPDEDEDMIQIIRTKPVNDETCAPPPKHLIKEPVEIAEDDGAYLEPEVAYLEPEEPQLCGGVSSGDHNCQAAQDIVTELRSGVEFFLKKNEWTGLPEETLPKFEIVKYASQVVAGTMHNVAVDIGLDFTLHLKIFECLPCNRNSGGPRFEIKYMEFGEASKSF